MTDREAVATILSQETCFCLHGAFKDCNSQCPIREALDHMIVLTKHHEDEVYAAYKIGYDEARKAYGGTGPDAKCDDVEEAVRTTTICDNCIHRNVCADEGHYDDALSFCADKVEERPTGECKIGGKTTHYHYCSICGKDGDLQDNFCRNCGAKMKQEVE